MNLREVVPIVVLVLIAFLIYSIWSGREFWKSVFSDNGAGSFSRVMSAASTLIVLGWGTFVVYKNGTIPSTDMVAMTLFTAAPYGLNVAAQVTKAAVSKPPAPVQTVVADEARVTQTNQ